MSLGDLVLPIKNAGSTIIPAQLMIHHHQLSSQNKTRKQRSHLAQLDQNIATTSHGGYNILMTSTELVGRNSDLIVDMNRPYERMEIHRERARIYAFDSSTTDL